MKYLGRKITSKDFCEDVARQDNCGCGLSNTRRIYWTEFYVERSTKTFGSLTEAKQYIKKLSKRGKT